MTRERLPMPSDTRKSLPLLQQAGEALYGPFWQSTLARSLNVSPRLVRYWLSGERQPPAWAWDALYVMLTDRALQLGDLAAELVDAG